MSIAENVEQVRARIARAADRAGRDSNRVTLVAVSKIFPAAAIREAYAAGVRHFGENRVQEWEHKHAALADLREATWHLVGHLQSNKVKRAAALFHSIDSLDGLALAGKLARAVEEAPDRSAETAEPQSEPRKRVLIEVRLSPEETKSGVEPENLSRLAKAVVELPRLELRGLMCIPPFFENPEEARPYFARLRRHREVLEAELGIKLPELSMGMSHDFEVAIAEGATQVRVGTAIFGQRKKD